MLAHCTSSRACRDRLEAELNKLKADLSESAKDDQEDRVVEHAQAQVSTVHDAMVVRGAAGLT